MRGRTMGFATTVAAVVVTIIATTAAPGLAAAKDEVTPERWVRGVCAAVDTWLDTAPDVDLETAATTDAVAAGDTTATAARVRLLAQYRKAGAATDRLVAKVAQAGTPAIADGSSVAAHFRATVRDLRVAYADAVRSTARLAKRSSTLDDDLTALQRDTNDAVTAIGDPLEELVSVPELADAITGTTSCGDVESFYHETASLGLKVGDCFDDSIMTVDCTQPHTGEVVFVGEHESPKGTPFPGDAAIKDWVGAHCLDPFAAYVGVDIDSSQYNLSWYSPEPSGWTDGDREISCYVDNVDESPLTGSVRGTAR